MKNYFIIITLLTLTSCNQKIENNLDAINDSKSNKELSSFLQDELSMDFLKNKDVPKDNKTKNQLSNEHKHNNKKR